MKNLERNFKLLMNDNLDELQKGDVIDYFLLKTREVIKKDDRKNAEIIINKFIEFEFLLEPNSFYRGFFFSLSHILQVFFVDDNVENKEDLEKNLSVSLRQLGENVKEG